MKYGLVFSALPTRQEASRNFSNQIGVQNQRSSCVSQFSGTLGSMEGKNSRFTNRISLKTLSNVVLNKPSFLEFNVSEVSISRYLSVVVARGREVAYLAATPISNF
jgi:hypothetical protein